MRRSFPLPLLLLLLAIDSAFTPVALAQVVVQSATPQAARPGQSTEIVLRGQKLATPLKVWTSLPLQVEVVSADGNEAKLKVTAAGDAPPQIGGLVVSTSDGASEPLFFAIDDLPSVADNGQNRALDRAQEIAALAAVDGVCDGTQSDFYKFTAQAGGKLSVEVFAGRLGSPLDPIIRVLDASGKELTLADDDASTLGDCRLSFTPPAAGVYAIEVRDVRYRGGAAYKYRLRVGDFPLITTAYPLGITAGQSGAIAFAGQNTEALGSVDVVGAAATERRQAIAIKQPASGQSSALASLVVSLGAQAVESEPNDSPETATKITLPGGISGRFQTRKDRDQYLFTAAANTTMAFRPHSRSLGSPSYVMLSIFKPDGGLLAELKSSETDEEPLLATFPAEGTYRLVVDELLRQGGPECTYYIDAAPHAGCALALKPDKNTPTRFALPKNGTIAVEVQAARSGYDGPITLTVEPASAGWVLRNNVIAAKQPATKLLIAAPPGAQAGDLLAARIVGHVEHQGQKLTIPVTTTALLRAKTPQLAYPPAWLDGLLTIAITGDMEPIFALGPPTTLLYARSAAMASQLIPIERKQKEFSELITIQVENLPEGVTAEVKRDGNGNAAIYSVVLKAPREVPEGAHELQLSLHAEFKGRGQLVTTALPVKFITPLTVNLTPLGNITPGQKQKVKVAVTRYAGEGADPQPVTIKWTKLPPGVATASDTTLAPDQTEGEVEFTAASEAAVAVFEGVVATATSTFQAQSIAIDSPPTKWEVK